MRGNLERMQARLEQELEWERKSESGGERYHELIREQDAIAELIREANERDWTANAASLRPGARPTLAGEIPNR